jgi:hypothetical protein
MNYSCKKKEIILIIIGLLFIAGGGVLNEWFLAALMSTDGAIALSHRITIWIVDICLIGTGFVMIRYRMFLTKETLFVVTGLLVIFSGIALTEKFVPAVIDAPMTSPNRLFMRGVEMYAVITGMMLILYRKSLDSKRVLLFGISSLFCFAMFVGYDWYRIYSNINKFQSAALDPEAQYFSRSLYAEDDKLGWKPVANISVRHSIPGEFDVKYEIDDNGFKKINNSKGEPDLSIYFFGDSFTFGDGVKNDDTFPNIIKEKYLNEKVNVYNAGVNGYGIVQMFQRFLNMKDRIQPGDLVIFTPIAIDIKRNLKDFAMVFYIIFGNHIKVKNFPYFDNAVITSRQIGNTFYNTLKLSAISAQYTGFLVRSIRNKFISDTTKESQEMMNIIEREMTLKGGEFILFFLPTPKEYSGGEYVVDIYGFDYFDILDFFPSEEEKMDKLRISKSNGHYSRRGHEIVAKAIVEILATQKLLSPKYLKAELKSSDK